MSSFFDSASLVQIPSGYSDGTLYSVKPIDGSGDLTFTRSNDTATRVGPDSLIEKVRTNLFRYSEQFDNATWSTQGSPIISANASVAPDGTTTADLFYPSVNGAIVAAIQSKLSASSVEYTQSVYVKASGKNFAALYTFNGGSGTAMWVNLTTGEITNGSGVNVSNRFATNVGNGWWRIGFTDLGNGATSYMHVYPTDAASSNSVTASGTDGILLWGAQLETGVATDYIATTSAAVSVGPVADLPRLDYTDSTCPKLLLEPQRTNLITFSESFDNADWIKQDATITANAAVSPSGYQDADLYTSSSVIYDFARQTKAFTSGTAYTLSVFAKAGTSNLVSLTVPGAAFGSGGATFNLSSGTIVSNTGGTVSIVDYGSGWFRCSFNKTATASSSGSIGFADGGAVAVSDLYLWGAQLEEGAYATSYIPTLGAAVTRAVDVCYKTGIGSLFGTNAGTIYFETIYDPATNLGGGERWIYAQGNTSSDYVRLWQDVTGGAKKIRVLVAAGGVSQANIAKNATAVGLSNTASSTIKFAFAYEDNRFQFYVNGINAGIDTSGTAPTITEINFNSTVQTIFPLAQCLVFPTALTNAQLAELTA